MKILCLTLALLGVAYSTITVYNVTAHRYSTNPLINTQNSAWNYAYNPAAYTYEGEINLLVRGQNFTNSSNPYSTGPSYFSPSEIGFNNGFPNATSAEYIAFDPSSDDSAAACGTEDARVVEVEGIYHIFYTAYNCSNAILSQAISTNPADPETWENIGPVFPNYNWSKSGAALYADKTNNFTENYLFWGDSTAPQGGIGIATSQDGVHWTDTGNLLIQTRNAPYFDTALVEAGPPPVRLSTGDYLFIYNSARSGYPSVKPDWELQYNAGFVILSHNNPTTVTQRSLLPLLSPMLPWELGNSTGFLTPDVVFVEGLVPDPNPCPSGNYNCFVAFYGGADTCVGAARVVVNWYTTEDDGNNEENNQNQEEPNHTPKLHQTHGDDLYELYIE